MSDVLQLFKIENPPDPKTIVAIAVAGILSNFNRVKTHESGSTVAWVVHRNAMAYVVLKKQ
jgi:hypothetical protein